MKYVDFVVNSYYLTEDKNGKIGSENIILEDECNNYLHYFRLGLTYLNMYTDNIHYEYENENNYISNNIMGLTDNGILISFNSCGGTKHFYIGMCWSREN